MSAQGSREWRDLSVSKCLMYTRICLQFSDPSYFYQPFIRINTAEMELEPRIEIFMLKLVCRENVVLFRHSRHELQRFKNLDFDINSKNLYGICRCSDNVTPQRHIPYKCIVKTNTLYLVP